MRAIEAWAARAAGEEPRPPSARRGGAPGRATGRALRGLPVVTAADYAGSLRRRRSTVRDIDLVVASNDPAAVMDAFAALPSWRRRRANGATPSWSAVTHTGLNVDLRIVPPASYGNLLQHFTGSADHNVALRGYAQRRGYKISEYNVEHVDSGRPITCATEAEVYGTARAQLHPSRAAGEPGGDRGGRDRDAPGPHRAAGPARRPARALRLDRRPCHHGADGPRRPREGLWSTSASATTPSRWPMRAA